MPPAEAGRDSRSVDVRCPAARDGENPVVHLDEQDERAAVGQVDDLVGEVRDAVHVARPGDRRDQHLDSGYALGSDCGHQSSEQLALLVGQRCVEEPREQSLPGAVP